MVALVHNVADVRELSAAYRAAGARVALVPTMGALHAGHLALVRLAKTRCARVITSIFVNPRQFAPTEDLSRYPRDLDGDRAMLADAGCDAIWAPAERDMYPDGFATRVEVGGVAEGLETEFRPHHFGGVATVCLKLFTAAAPDIAMFGEKDYQQLCVVRQLVRDFNLPLAIVAGPTVREPDGLALSSRNAYLSADERAAAPALYQTLQNAAAAIRSGEPIEATCQRASISLVGAGFARVDYVACRDAETLAPAGQAGDRPLRLLAAAWLGRTRLIDNIAVTRSFQRVAQ